MKPVVNETAPLGNGDPGTLIGKLRKRKIIETSATFIAGSWLTYEIVHWILVAHFRLPERLLDITLMTLTGAFVALLVKLWFGGVQERPPGIRVEVLAIPLIAILTLAVDVKLVLRIFDIPGKTSLISLIALGLGVAWIVVKSLQWAARAPDTGKEETKDLIDSEPRSDKSIVVLPFKNISPEKGQEYFSDGITEEIISDLSRIRAFRVISRSSAMTYKGSAKTVPEIARELNVRYALEGSVRKAGNNLRITAQLIEAASDMHLWAEKFVGELADVFDIQERVSRAIVSALQQELAPEEERTISDRPIQNLRAYESYLRARRDMYQCSEESMERALQSLSQALEDHGENPLLFAALGLVHLQLYNTGFRTTEETLKKAERLLDRIIALEPESSHRYHLTGTIERSRGQIQKAVRSLKKAVDLEPNDPDTLGWLGYLLSINLGRPDLGKPYIKWLIEIDPLVAWNYSAASAYYLAKGNTDRALAMIRRSVQMDPADRNFRFWEAWYLAGSERVDEAIALIDPLVAEKADDLVATLCLSLKCALRQDKEQALRALNKKNREILWSDPEGPWLMAGVFAMLDDRTEALTWLERAVARGWANYPLFSRIDPFLANIRGERRFQKLMERVRGEWERFEL